MHSLERKSPIHPGTMPPSALFPWKATANIARNLFENRPRSLKISRSYFVPCYVHLGEFVFWMLARAISTNGFPMKFLDQSIIWVFQTGNGVCRMFRMALNFGGLVVGVLKTHLFCWLIWNLFRLMDPERNTLQLRNFYFFKGIQLIFEKLLLETFNGPAFFRLIFRWPIRVSKDCSLGILI